MKKKLSTFKIAFLFAITFLCFFTSCSDLDNLPYTTPVRDKAIKTERAALYPQ